MISAIEILTQNDGDVTKAYYSALWKHGHLGAIAVALFRAQKRSGRAKDYRRGQWRRKAYEIKQWSLGELCKLLTAHGHRDGFVWGWSKDESVRFGEDASFVLYVEIPEIGQCSFHSPDRGEGPDYDGQWDGQKASGTRICRFCDKVMPPTGA